MPKLVATPNPGERPLPKVPAFPLNKDDEPPPNGEFEYG